ncbi:DUF3987 domain-containing protein [Urechidicola croceus]|uniref:DUF3987 domain-containing protein n=1 Tax=Urechidicola croceus TaxID=1850246 RepID=A0A1D8P7R7_9FLAO|nr:DUF3987 domain-containing protein [Urechidicola croceus]AOW20592.1 hypothetical protein LPB138_07835 [Urechidicola croceus]
MVKSIKDIEKKLNDLTISGRDKSLEMLNEVLKYLPKEYVDLINEAFIYKRIPKEYLLSSILFTISTALGLTFYIKALGYKNYANLYFTIVGSRGDTKSEGLKLATIPLKELDDKDYEEYCFDLNNYKSDIDSEPLRKQTLIQNSSIEAVHKIHSENPNSIGIYIDEVYSLVEKMGNSSSRDGVAWRTFLLEGYTNGFVDVSRKTTKSFRIKETYPTLLGGIQKEFVPKLFANGNLESGFVDRQLFMPRLTKNKKLKRGSMSSEVIESYNNLVFNILQYKRQSENEEEDKKQFEIVLSEAAEEKLFSYTQELIDRQETAKSMIKEYMSKMQISIHKFSLLVHMMKISGDMNYTKLMDENTVDVAITLNEFYFNNFKIILKENLKVVYKEPSLSEVVLLAKKNGASQKVVSEITGYNKSTVSKCWNKEKNIQKLETSLKYNRVC